MRFKKILTALVVLPASGIFSSFCFAQTDCFSEWLSDISDQDHAENSECIQYPHSSYAEHDTAFTTHDQATASINFFVDDSFEQKRNYGTLVTLQIPFGKLSASSATPLHSPATPHNKPFHPQVKPSLARACVHAAWRAHGLERSQALQNMKSRARASSLLPEARLRYARDWGQSYRITPLTDESYRLNESNTGARTIEARLTWRLNRLLFTDEELPIERLSLQREQQRSKLTDRVLKALFEWQRARVVQMNPSLEPAEQLDAAIREAESIALLDVLTAGWFSTWMATSSKPDSTETER